MKTVQHHSFHPVYFTISQTEFPFYIKRPDALWHESLWSLRSGWFQALEVILVVCCALLGQSQSILKKLSWQERNVLGCYGSVQFQNSLFHTSESKGELSGVSSHIWWSMKQPAVSITVCFSFIQVLLVLWCTYHTFRRTKILVFPRTEGSELVFLPS